MVRAEGRTGSERADALRTDANGKGQGLVGHGEGTVGV